jgi:hypothetical protein
MLPSTYLCLGIRWVYTFQQQEQPITFVYFVLLADIKAQHMGWCKAQSSYCSSTNEGFSSFVVN